MNIGQALAMASERLAGAGVPEAASDARALWKLAAGERLIDPSQSADKETLARFLGFLERRAAREPVSHIAGERAFYQSTFRVTPDVLDPRPETELLVELALEAPFNRVLDLGTGSGCILISLLQARSNAKGVGTDISPAAVLVAGENAARHGVADRLVLPLSEWFDDIGGRFDLIVSNPPYIPEAEIDCLAPEVKDWEPRAALTDGANGLSAYRVIAERARDHLTPGGRLMVEIGPGQADDVTEFFLAGGLENVVVHADLSGRDRVVSARAAHR